MKRHSLSLIAFFVLTASINAFAGIDDLLAEYCLDVGKAKVAAQAEAYGCKVDLNQIQVQEIDNRWYNPSKYIWYQVMGPCNGQDRVIQLVQYYNGNCY